MSRKICTEAAPTPDGSPTWCDCLGRSCVLAEMRALSRPGGAKAAMEAYREDLRDRAGRRESGADPSDIAYRMQKIGVPAEDILALRAPRLDESVALAAAKRFLGAPQQAALRFLLLSGGVGVGKTLAASYVVRDEARRFDWNGQASGGVAVEPIQFVRAGELTRIDSRDRLDTQRLDGMAKCRLLVVDDAGDEGGPIGRGALAETLLRRDAGARRTVITTNLTLEKFAEIYGGALVDRIRVRGITPNLAKEKSRRKKAA